MLHISALVANKRVYYSLQMLLMVSTDQGNGAKQRSTSRKFPATPVDGRQVKRCGRYSWASRGRLVGACGVGRQAPCTRPAPTDWTDDRRRIRKQTRPPGNRRKQCALDRLQSDRRYKARHYRRHCGDVTAAGERASERTCDDVDVGGRAGLALWPVRRRRLICSLRATSIGSELVTQRCRLM